MKPRPGLCPHLKPLSRQTVREEVIDNCPSYANQNHSLNKIDVLQNQRNHHDRHQTLLPPHTCDHADSRHGYRRLVGMRRSSPAAGPSQAEARQKTPPSQGPPSAASAAASPILVIPPRRNTTGWSLPGRHALTAKPHAGPCCTGGTHRGSAGLFPDRVLFPNENALQKPHLFRLPVHPQPINGSGCLWLLERSETLNEKASEHNSEACFPTGRDGRI